MATLVPAPGQVGEHPERVELELVRRAVADANRACAAEAIEVELGLDQPPLAADAIGDPQVLDVTGGRALDEAAEAVGLAVVSEVGEAAGGEGGVADPGVAVVPVPVAALSLGQRRGGRGDDGAAGRVGEGLED